MTNKSHVSLGRNDAAASVLSVMLIDCSYLSWRYRAFAAHALRSGICASKVQGGAVSRCVEAWCGGVRFGKTAGIMGRRIQRPSHCRVPLRPPSSRPANLAPGGCRSHGASSCRPHGASDWPRALSFLRCAVAIGALDPRLLISRIACVRRSSPAV